MRTSRPAAARVALSLVSVLALGAGAAACRQPVTHVHVDGARADTPQPGQFVVVGTAVLDVRPDVADLHLTIAAEAPRARVAATQLRARQAELRQALIAAGIAAEDLTFSSLGIQPVYDEKRERVRGYRAAIDLTATTASFEALPELLEVAVGAGATNLTTERRVLDLPARKREVRDLALAAAKAKAEQTASALGVKLGRITSISEGSGDGYGWNGRWGAELPNAAGFVQAHVAAPSGGPTLSGDAQQLSLTISLTYEL
ncbi:MAG: SIMPL domain-containing protein [Myxococcales bacterium]|nr:SIMPL domain-containing protein [Myxococcales bacterium]